MEPSIINGKKYYWISNASKKQIKDWLQLWQDFSFRHEDKDYYIKRGKDGFVICDPQIDSEGCLRTTDDSADYPESMMAKAPEEFLELHFLDGKTILEQLPQLRFFEAFHTKHFFDNVDDMKPDILEEFIENGQPFYFTFRDQDYLIEGFLDLGYVIVEPKLYYSEGGWPEKTNAAYPCHLQAKTSEEFMALPFLDGKTIFQRFNELRFFDM